MKQKLWNVFVGVCMGLPFLMALLMGQARGNMVLGGEFALFLLPLLVKCFKDASRWFKECWEEGGI